MTCQVKLENGRLVSDVTYFVFSPEEAESGWLATEMQFVC